MTFTDFTEITICDLFQPQLYLSKDAAYEDEEQWRINVSMRSLARNFDLFWLETHFLKDPFVLDNSFDDLFWFETHFLKDSFAFILDHRFDDLFFSFSIIHIHRNNNGTVSIMIHKHNHHNAPLQTSAPPGLRALRSGRSATDEEPWSEQHGVKL